MNIGSVVGWLIGVGIAIYIVWAIPGDQSGLAFFLSFSLGFSGYFLGYAVERGVRSLR